MGIIWRSLSNSLIGLVCVIWIFSVLTEELLPWTPMPFIILEYMKAVYLRLANLVLPIYLIWSNIAKNEEMSHSENAAALLSQMRFQNADAISKCRCDFKTQMRFQNADAISKCRCDFKTQMRFQNADAISKRRCVYKTPGYLYCEFSVESKHIWIVCATLTTEAPWHHLRCKVEDVQAAVREA